MRKRRRKITMCRKLTICGSLTMRGSLTIEAAIIVPLLLMVFALTMESALTMYDECKETAALIMEESGPDTVKLFYRWKAAGELLNESVDGQ